jgi:uncharacterized protein
MTGSFRKRILVDTGPIVAILNPEDSYHQICLEASSTIDGPLYTCWPVITEAAHLLSYSSKAVQRLLNSLDGSFLRLFALDATEAKAVGAVMKRYENLRAQLADASLVYLAAREQIETIFTLDRRDFSVYRTGKGGAFRIIPQVG